MASPIRSRCWVFTHNNYTDEDIITWNNINCKYICYGKEVAPTTGTQHLQGYIVFENAMRFTTLKKKVSNVVHLDIARGNAQQNIEYCSKGGEFYERGDRPAQGHRLDLDLVRTMAADGGMRNVTLVFNAQAIRVAEKYLTYHERFRDFKPKVYWFWGPTGSGKTRKAFDMFPDRDDVWVSSGSLKWWPKYDQHKYVIIDDFRESDCSLKELLRMLDRYEYQVEVKGGYRQLLAEVMVFTSPMHPKDLRYDSREDINQLLRRIDVIEGFKDVEVGDTAVTEVTEVGGNTDPDLLQMLDELTL